MNNINKCYSRRTGLTYTKENIIEIIRKIYEEKGKVVAKDFTYNPKYPSDKVVRNLFGSWNDAVEAADCIYTGKHKISVSFDEENYFLVVIDNERFIRNPTGDDLKGATEKSYNKTNICDICREEKETNEKVLTDRSILYPHNALRERDINNKETGRWNCKNCYEKCCINSNTGIKKLLRDRRTGNLRDPYLILGDNCEKLTDVLFGAERLAIKYDKYAKLPVDHGFITKNISIIVGDNLVHLYGMIPQTKGRSYSSRYGMWGFKPEKDSKFDILVLYCLNKDRNTIERIHIIPKERATETSSISIYKNPMSSRGTFPIISIYEQYRVNDEKILELANKKWEKIMMSLATG